MKPKKWLISLLTTVVLILNSLFVYSIQQTDSVFVSELTQSLPMLIAPDRTVSPEQEEFLHSTRLNEVRTDKVYITTRSMYPKYYTQTNISKSYVDSIVHHLTNELSTVFINFVLEQRQINELRTQERNRIEAKAYLSIPISVFLWLFLLLIGNKIENKQLIIVSLILLICSIVGSFIVFPTIIINLII